MPLPRLLAGSALIVAAGCSPPTRWVSICEADLSKPKLGIEAYVSVFDLHTVVAFDPACPKKTVPIGGWAGGDKVQAAREKEDILRITPRGLAIRYRLEVMPYVERGQTRLTIFDFERLGVEKTSPVGEEPPPPSIESSPQTSPSPGGR